MEKNKITSVSLHNQHSNSAVVAVGYYGEVGYSSTPTLQNQSAVSALKSDWDF